jgi:hypothetical protein
VVERGASPPLQIRQTVQSSAAFRSPSVLLPNGFGSPSPSAPSILFADPTALWGLREIHAKCVNFTPFFPFSGYRSRKFLGFLHKTKGGTGNARFEYKWVDSANAIRQSSRTVYQNQSQNQQRL